MKIFDIPTIENITPNVKKPNATKKNIFVKHFLVFKLQQQKKTSYTIITTSTTHTT